MSTFYKEIQTKEKQTRVSVNACFLQRNPNKRKKTCISVYVCFLQRNPMKEKNLYECLQALNNVLCVTLVRATWSILSQRRSPYAGTCPC